MYNGHREQRNINISSQETKSKRFHHINTMYIDIEIWFMVFMVLSATLNNISVVSWRSVLLVGETTGVSCNLSGINQENKKLF
jgi:hypothetical protein